MRAQRNILTYKQRTCQNVDRYSAINSCWRADKRGNFASVFDFLIAPSLPWSCGPWIGQKTLVLVCGKGDDHWRISQFVRLFCVYLEDVAQQTCVVYSKRRKKNALSLDEHDDNTFLKGQLFNSDIYMGLSRANARCLPEFGALERWFRYYM